MQFTGHQYIGHQTKGANEATFTGFDAATGEPLPTRFSEATAAETDEAAQLAHRDFSAYSRKSGAEKALFLEAIAAEIMALGTDLITFAMRETALPEARLTGERGRTTGQLHLFAQLLREGSWVNARIDTAQPDRQPLPKPDIRQMLVALGPVCVFGASNFPLAFSVAGGDTVSALAAGCPVVFKAHPAHPHTCELVAADIVRAARATNMPEGVFSMVHGVSTAVGMALVQHPHIKAVGFTGSYRGGKAIYDAAVRRPEPIPVYAEMGSTNPVFFLPGILREKGDALAAQMAGAIILGAGQFCTNPGVFLVAETPEGNRFIEQTAHALNEVSTHAMLTGGIRQAYLSGIGSLRSVPDTELLTDFSDETVRPHLLKTSLAAALRHLELTEEVFGPSSVAVVAGSPDGFFDFVRAMPGHLTATVWGTDADLEHNRALLDALRDKVGRVIVNGFPTGVEVTHAMTQGGPFPATTDARSTSVGTLAIERFARPVSFQNFPPSLLPDELKDNNPLGIWRSVNGMPDHMK